MIDDKYPKENVEIRRVVRSDENFDFDLKRAKPGVLPDWNVKT